MTRDDEDMNDSRKRYVTRAIPNSFVVYESYYFGKLIRYGNYLWVPRDTLPA
jgi:hypothetical protein